MKFFLLNTVVFCGLLILVSCIDGENAVKDMATVIKGANFLKDFYQESNRLPTDDNELLKFCQSKNDTLNLSEFSQFKYYMNSDSTAITIDFEFKSSPQNKGSFSIDI